MPTLVSEEDRDQKSQVGSHVLQAACLAVRGSLVHLLGWSQTGEAKVSSTQVLDQ